MGALLVLISLKLFRRKRGSKEYFESYILKLLEGGKYQDVVDLATLYLSKSPGDTFVRRVLAESYEKLGRYLESADLCSEIASELGKKGLGILAEGFKEKAEKLYANEFKKG